MSGKPVIILPITQMSASIASIGNFSSRRLLPVIAKLTDEAKLLITENWIDIYACVCIFMVYIPASAAVTGIPLIRVITVVKMPVHVPKKHAAEISDPKTAWNEVIGCDILPQRPVIPKNML